jgi:protein-tyrosine-phosphatase
MKKRFRVLFVCSGNTCRSPLAEALLKKRLAEERVGNVSVSSAGLSAIEGMPAAANSKTVAKELGASLAGFRSKRLTDRRVALADLILVMEPGQAEQLLARWPEALDKVHVISELSGTPRRGIADPVGGSLAVYRKCGLAIEDEIRRIVPRIKRLKKARRRK